MENQDNICREGVVRDIKDHEVLVEIIVSSACSGCHAKSICIPSDRRQEKIWIKKTDNQQFEIGETVNIILESSAGNKAVVLAYVIPLVVLLVLMLTIFSTTHNELLSIAISVLGVVVYYLILKSYNSKLDKEISFSVEKKN